MGFIFVGSTDILAEHRTSRWLAPFLRWLKPDISEATLSRVQLVIRKGGHLTEFALVAVLACRALSFTTTGKPEARTLKVAWGALAWGVSYAILDEFHQSFYATRQASAMDVGIDACGVSLGVALWWLARGWLRKR
jgi:VanZ family protein